MFFSGRLCRFPTPHLLILLSASVLVTTWVLLARHGRSRNVNASGSRRTRNCTMGYGCSHCFVLAISNFADHFLKLLSERLSERLGNLFLLLLLHYVSH
jgi:hypothetical protein